MKLYVNRPSPYGRKALVAAIESGQSSKLEVIQVDPWTEDPEFLAVVPAGRVPALQLNGSVLLESTAIALALMEMGGRHAPGSKERHDELVRTGLAQALIDAAYNTVIERRRPAELQWSKWGDRQQTAIARMLAACPTPAAERFDVGDISLACALGYMDFRLPEIDWRKARPELAKWFGRIAELPSMTATDPRTGGK